MAISQRVRFEIFRRDRFTCQYCGRQAPAVTLECDHIRPRSEGGPETPENLATACAACNHGKSDTAATPERADWTHRDWRRWEATDPATMARYLFGYWMNRGLPLGKWNEDRARILVHRHSRQNLRAAIRAAARRYRWPREEQHWSRPAGRPGVDPWAVFEEETAAQRDAGSIASEAP